MRTEARYISNHERRVPVHFVTSPVGALRGKNVEEDKADSGHEVHASEVVGGEDGSYEDTTYRGSNQSEQTSKSQYP